MVRFCSARQQTPTFKSGLEQIYAFVSRVKDAKQQPQLSCSYPLVCQCLLVQSIVTDIAQDISLPFYIWTSLQNWNWIDLRIPCDTPINFFCQMIASMWCISRNEDRLSNTALLTSIVMFWFSALDVHRDLPCASRCFESLSMDVIIHCYCDTHNLGEPGDTTGRPELFANLRWVHWSVIWMRLLIRLAG